MTADSSNNALHALVAEFRGDAALLRRLTGNESSEAFAYEHAANRLQEALADESQRLLGASEAAALMGCHRDTIGNAIRDGRLANNGTKYRPLVRLDDLTRVFGRKTVARLHLVKYDGITDARSRVKCSAGRI